MFIDFQEQVSLVELVDATNPQTHNDGNNNEENELDLQIYQDLAHKATDGCFSENGVSTYENLKGQL